MIEWQIIWKDQIKIKGGFIQEIKTKKKKKKKEIKLLNFQLKKHDLIMQVKEIIIWGEKEIER